MTEGLATWIGLKYDPETSKWSWTDGQEMDYENWDTGEPNNLETEHCTNVKNIPSTSSHGTWNNLPCSMTRAFGCEFFPSELSFYLLVIMSLR